MEILQKFVDLGPIVVLPIIIFVFGLLLGTKPGKAFISGLTVGIGFVGLNLVIDLLGSSLGPAAQAMVERMGLSLTTIDVGWPAASAISYGTVLGSLVIPIGIALNILLLVLGLTQTLNVDIWNYWHGAFIASIGYALTGSFPLAITFTIVYLLILHLMADIVAPKISEFYGFPNITFPHGMSLPGYFFALPFNKLFDKIPGLKDLDANPDTIQKRFGIFGDSKFMGLIIGIVIGILAGYDFSEIAQLGVKTSAIMVLMPRMVSLLMEGLTPISEAANAYVQKKFPGRDVYIGMDSALSVGHPSVLASSLIMVPITILLAVILPGNETLPFGDLATIPFMVCLMVAVFNGNIIRTVITATVYMVFALYISSWMAPLVTSAAKAANFDLGGYSSITVLSDGGVWTTYMYVQLLDKAKWIGVIILGFLAIAALYKVNKKGVAKND